MVNFEIFYRPALWNWEYIALAVWVASTTLILIILGRHCCQCRLSRKRKAQILAVNKIQNNGAVPHKVEAEKTAATASRAEITQRWRRFEILWARRDLEDAERILIEIIALDREHLPAQLHLAEIYLARENFSKAKITAERILENNPELVRALVVLGQVALATANWAQARHFFEQVLAQDTKDVAHYLFLAQAYEQENQTELVQKCLESALKIAPKNLEIIKKLLAIFQQTNSQQEFAELLKYGLQLAPYDSDLRALQAST